MKKVEESKRSVVAETAIQIERQGPGTVAGIGVGAKDGVSGTYDRSG